MRIDRIELWHVQAPLPASFLPSWIPGFEQHQNRFTLIRLRTRSGLEGFSAAAAMGKERQGLGSLLGPYFLGERADDLEGIRQRIREMGYLGHRTGWIEPACWDLIGKSRKQPVYEILGGEAGRIRLYASTGEMRPIPERVETVIARREEGFDTLKLRVHAETVEEDIALIRGVREAVGDSIRLGVDANQGWRVSVVADAPRWDAERALAFCRAAQELDFSWVEEPLPMDDFEGLTHLAEQVEIPIAGGELHVRGLPELQSMIDRRCYDVFQPDATFTGGIAETWAVARRALAAGLSYTPHTWTNGIGFAINLQLFAALADRETARLEYPLEPPGWVPEARDALLATPWHHENGSLQLPIAPGLGFEIDRGALSRWGRRFYVGSKARVAISAIRDKGLGLARRLGSIRDDRLVTRSRELDSRIAAGRDPVTETLESL
jgi:D-galactarolactone cycloisomerase